MTEDFKKLVIEALQRGEELPSEWARELFPPEKREYELVYHGKEREEDIRADTMAVPLQQVSVFGVPQEDEWQNQLIFGDNLQVLKTLIEKKNNGELNNADGVPGVRLIYIDPPFATRKEFSGSSDQKAYQDKIAGAKFIEFLRKRLVLIRELLSDDGVLYVHLDWRKCHYIKGILDEIFGEANFQNEIIWQRLSARSDSKTYNHIHDIIYFYTKTQNFRFETQYSDYSDSYVKKFYRFDDGDGRLYSLGDLTARGIRNGETGKPWREVDPSRLGNHWKVRPSKLDELDKQGKIYWPPKGKVPRLKQYLDEQKGRPLQSIWSDISAVQYSSSENSGYPTQKPEALLERIIKASSKKGDLVMDAFAGSGTTLTVAEKLDRRWIGIDCGKFSIYTIQKRMLSLKSEVGNNGASWATKPFTVCNAGLYDFSQLRKLSWKDWRFFALQLFGCKDEPHEISKFQLDGRLRGASVLVFNHIEHAGQRVDEETINNIHRSIGSRLQSRFFIIAPRNVFDFQQDYIDLGEVRYYALRIPYSVINELHRRNFSAMRQPNDENDVNATVDAVGFDFIQPPKVSWEAGIRKSESSLFEEAYLKINSFESRARIRGAEQLGHLETFSMLMLDYDYDKDIFEFDDAFYADQLKKEDWTVKISPEKLGHNIMAVFIDIYGNEARELILQDQFTENKNQISAIGGD